MSNKQNRQLASVNRYANALFQLAKEAKVLDSVASDLSNLEKIINSDNKIFLFIKNPSIKKSVKMNFFESISKKIELSKLSLNFIGVIIKKNRIYYLLDMINSFNETTQKLVDLDDTIKGFDAICKGEYDHLPEAAFYMVGGIEEVIEKAEKLSKDNK